MSRKTTGGPLMRRTLNSTLIGRVQGGAYRPVAPSGQANAVGEMLQRLAPAVTADGKRLTYETRLEHLRDEYCRIADAEFEAAESAEHPHPNWYAAEIGSRLRKALSGVEDEAAKRALWLAFEAGALAREATLYEASAKLEAMENRHYEAKGLRAKNGRTAEAASQRHAEAVARAHALWDAGEPKNLSGMAARLIAEGISDASAETLRSVLRQAWNARR